MGDQVTTTLGPYLERAGRIPLLRADEEVDLAKRAAAGAEASRRLTVDPAPDPGALEVLRGIVRDGERASSRLLEANLRLVVSVAQRYRGSGLELPDLVQEGNLGLLKAVERFDPTKGYRFSTYATWWIRQAIGRGLADRARTVRLPLHAHELLVKLRWVELELWQQLGRAPNEQELADRVGVRAERVRDIRRAGAETTSLDAPAGEGAGVPLSARFADDDAPDPAAEVADADATAVLHAAIEQLDERERQVLTLRFGLGDELPMTLEQVGQRLGVTRERIRQIELRALRRLAHRSLEDLRYDRSA